MSRNDSSVPSYPISSPERGRGHSVVVSGRVLYQNREFETWTKRRLAREVSAKLWEHR